MPSANKIVLASGNAGKLREFADLFAPRNIAIVPQADFDVPDADETGLTFVENAIIKARQASALTGLPAIADDSGIEVDALNGAPGIYSARFAARQQAAAASTGDRNRDNLNALLTAMDGVAEADRAARYQCVLVYMRHAADPTPLICQASWEGRLLTAPAGEGGFGYDPIFWVDSESATAAQISGERKHQLSHRGQAVRQFIKAFA